MDAALKTQISGAIKAAESGQLVQGCMSLLSILQGHSLLVKQTLAPDQVGTHPANRDGLGLSAQDIMELIAAIVEVGFDGNVPNPVAIETPASDAKTHQFNQGLADQSNGILPAFNANVMKCASISSSHTNAAMRCLLHGSPGCAGMHDDLMIGGRFSLELLGRKDPIFKSACETGLTWRIISHVVVSEFPQVPSLLQSALNASGHLGKPEHEVQVLRRIYNLISSQGAKSWAEMKGTILRSRPACAPAAPFMHRFILKMSFGAPGLWDRVETFLRTSANSGRQLGPDFYEALACDPKPATSDACIFLRHAMLLAAYTIPVTKFITDQDVKRLLSKDLKEKAVSANDLISKCWKLVAGNSSIKMDFQIQTAMAAFEIDLILMLLHKRHATLAVAISEGEAACKLMDSIEILQGIRLSDEWDASRPSTSLDSQDSNPEEILVWQLSRPFVYMVIYRYNVQPKPHYILQYENPFFI